MAQPTVSEIDALPLGERFPIGDTGLTYRLVDPGDLTGDDLTALIRLLRRAFNGGPGWFDIGPSPEEHFSWKASSEAGPAHVQLIEDGGRIVGMSLTVRRLFLLKGEQVWGSEGVDVALDPDYQGRGLNAARRELRDRLHVNAGVSHSWGFSMHPLSRGYRGVNPDRFAVGNQVDALIRPLSLWRIAAGARVTRSDGAQSGASNTRSVLLNGRRSLRRRLDPARLATALRLGWSMLRYHARPRREAPWQLRTVERFDERANDFWREAAQAFDAIRVRDRTYLNWRYCDSRAGQFTVRVVEEEEGVLLGYAVTRASEREAILADLLVLPGRDDIARSLIADAVAVARAADAPFLRCWMALRHPYRAALRHAGFVRYDADLHLTYRVWDGDPEQLRFMQEPDARIHIMTADTDHV